MEKEAERDDELKAMKDGLSTKTAIARAREVWNESIRSEVAEHYETETKFDFPKLHLMSHFMECIALYGNLLQWSTETGELAHKALKTGWRHSNKTGDFYAQILQHQCRQEAFGVRKMNVGKRCIPLDESGNVDNEDELEELEDEELRSTENSISTVEDTTLVDASRNANADTAGRAGTVINATLSALGAQRAGQQTPQNMRITLASIQNRSGAVRTYKQLHATTRPDLKDEFHNAMGIFLHKMNIPVDDLLDDARVTVFHSIKVPVVKLDQERIEFQNIRCTGTSLWKTKAIRNDWVWVEHTRLPSERRVANREFGALKGKLPYRLLRVFKIQVIGEVNPLWLGFVEVTIPVRSGEPESSSLLVRVIRPKEGAYKVIAIRDIRGAAHLIPERPQPGQPEKEVAWVVNCHINLETWNHYYL